MNNVDSSFYLRPKLHPPALPPDCIVRPRLHQKLDRGSAYPLTLISAPAGYGKTVLLSAWVAQIDRPVAWLSLDKGENDPGLFLGYVIRALRRVFPNFGEALLALAQATRLPPLAEIGTLLINEIDLIDREFVLVLEDYHCIVAAEIHELLDGILLHPPRWMHLVVTSRFDPPLYLNRLRAGEQVMELRARDLRFSAAETASFVQQALGPGADQRTIGILDERTEGWPVGLRLATIALGQWGVSEHEPSILQVENPYVVDYLIHEVFSRQSTAVRDFLLYASVVERFCSPLCAALVASDFSEAAVQKAIALGLFVESLDGQNKWYRFHQLFRQVLYRRLTEELSADEVAALHLRASNWLAANGFVEAAIDHALRASALAQAVNILIQHSPILMRRERWLLLDRLLAKFPAAVVDAEPRLLLLLAWRSLSKYERQRAVEIAERARSRAEGGNIAEEDARYLEASCHLFSAMRLNWACHLERAIEHAREALAIAHDDWVLERSYAWVHLVTATYRLKGKQAALALVAEREQMLPRDPEVPCVRTELATCLVHWMAADLPYLLRTAAQADKQARQAGLAESTAWFAYFMACANYQLNRLDLAEEQFGMVIDNRYVAHPVSVVQSAIGLAKIYQAQERPDAARAMVETTLAFCQDVQDADLLLMMEGYEAELAWQQGDRAPARHWLDQPRCFSEAMPYLFDPQMTLPRLLIARDTPSGREAAAAELVRLRETVATTHNTMYLIDVLALQALLFYAEGNGAAAGDSLREALLLARPGGVVRLFLDYGPPLCALMNQLVASGAAPSFAAEVLAAFPRASHLSVQTAEQALVEPLTSREMDVLELMAERLSNKEIAGILTLSPATVKRHTVNIYQKLLVGNRREAVAKAVELGLLLGSH